MNNIPKPSALSTRPHVTLTAKPPRKPKEAPVVAKSEPVNPSPGDPRMDSKHKHAIFLGNYDGTQDAKCDGGGMMFDLYLAPGHVVYVVGWHGMHWEGDGKRSSKNPYERALWMAHRLAKKHLRDSGK